MQRISIRPRSDWKTRVESLGFLYHTNSDDSLYWDESAYYLFSEKEVLVLEKATQDLYELCLQAGQYIIDRRLYSQMKIPSWTEPLIERAWQEEPPSLYGRFDLAYDGTQPPKLLEFNADTPTSLLESAVAQWYWLQDVDAQADQFNSLHERLIAKWRDLRSCFKGNRLHLTCARDNREDELTCAYLADCAQQAGLDVEFLYVDEIGWDARNEEFVDRQENPITDLFKLYPWEWLTSEGEEFSRHIPAVERKMHWIEPIWKMLWSNKGLLPVLWQLFPNHSLLLPAYFDGPRNMSQYARKPLLSREGANIALRADGWELSTEGAYGEEGYIYQQLAPLARQEGNYAVIGSWIIDGTAAGMGIRESREPITNNQSRFLPHLFR